MGLGTGHASWLLEPEAEALVHKACRAVAILAALDLSSYYGLLEALFRSILPQTTVIGVHTAATGRCCRLFVVEEPLLQRLQVDLDDSRRLVIFLAAKGGAGQISGRGFQWESWNKSTY